MHVQGIDDDNNENNVTLSACPGEQWCHYSKKKVITIFIAMIFPTILMNIITFMTKGKLMPTYFRERWDLRNLQTERQPQRPKKADNRPAKEISPLFMQIICVSVFCKLAALWLRLNCWWNSAVEASLLLQGVPKRGIFRIAGLGTDYGACLNPSVELP